MLRIITPPEGLPATVDGLKQYALVEHDSDDALLKSLLTVATNKAQDLTNRVLVLSECELWRYRVGFNPVLLPAPVVRVTQVACVDTSIPVILPPETYSVDVNREPGVLTLKTSPDGMTRTSSLAVRFWAGWPIIDGVWQGPQDIAMYIYSCAAFVYDNRDADPYAKFSGLLSNYVVF